MSGKHTPIRIGDRFQTESGILEVIGTKPFGKIELMDRARTRFHSRYTREMRDWPRITTTTPRPSGGK